MKLPRNLLATTSLASVAALVSLEAGAQTIVVTTDGLGGSPNTSAIYGAGATLSDDVLGSGNQVIGAVTGTQDQVSVIFPAGDFPADLGILRLTVSDGFTIASLTGASVASTVAGGGVQSANCSGGTAGLSSASTLPSSSADITLQSVLNCTGDATTSDAVFFQIAFAGGTGSTSSTAPTLSAEFRTQDAGGSIGNVVLDGASSTSPFTIFSIDDGTSTATNDSGMATVTVLASTGFLRSTAQATSTDPIFLGGLGFSQDAATVTEDLASSITTATFDTTVGTLNGDLSAFNAAWLSLDGNSSFNTGTDIPISLTDGTFTLASTNVPSLVASPTSATQNGAIFATTDGVTQLPTSPYALAGSFNFTDPDYVDASFNGSLTACLRDGYTAEIPFFGSQADASANFIYFLRTQNTSSVDGLVRIAIQADGDTTLGTATVFNLTTSDPGVNTFTDTDLDGSLDPGGSLEITQQAIEAVTGTTIASGQRYRVQVTGEFPSGRSVAFLINPNGAITSIPVSEEDSGGIGSSIRNF